MSTISKSTYSLVTAAYWAFMLTDGALRMVVLLHFHKLGFSPVQLAFLFLLYEFAGIVTNLIGGWIGSKYGLKRTLFVGLFTHDSEKKLFIWVALLTGLKNALKGVGFFLGGFLLLRLGYQNALLSLAGLLIITLTASLTFVRGDFGKAKKKIKFTQLFSKSQAINLLSFSRSFLFASRDVWFVVGLPIFLHEQLKWSFDQVGGFMAAWVIIYGLVQASAPKIAGTKKGLISAVKGARLWGVLLVGICLALATAVSLEFHPVYSLLIGLGIFGFIFAVNSSIHSYLILAYTESDDVSVNVGFYYMANAAGRLSGTLLSGLMYLAAGLPGCLWTAAALCAVDSI